MEIIIVVIVVLVLAGLIERHGSNRPHDDSPRAQARQRQVRENSARVAREAKRRERNGG